MGVMRVAGGPSGRGLAVDDEPNILELLTAARGAEKVACKRKILDRAGNEGFGGDSRIVESYISYLRGKVDFTRLDLIRTVRGMGYVVAPLDERSCR